MTLQQYAERLRQIVKPSPALQAYIQQISNYAATGGGLNLEIPDRQWHAMLALNDAAWFALTAEDQQRARECAPD